MPTVCLLVGLLALLPAMNARPGASPFVSIPLKLLGNPQHSTLDPQTTHFQHSSRAIHRIARVKRAVQLLPRLVSREDDDDDDEGYTRVGIDASMSGDLAKARKPSHRHSIGLDIEANDIGYIGHFLIGTPPREFRLLVDSGSADTWVGMENCVAQDGGSCGEHHKYLGPWSSTFKFTDEPWEIRYGSGACSGSLVTDVFRIGDLTLPSHKFGVARNESSQFTAATIYFDGLMGLARSVLSQQRTDTPLDALAAAKLIPAPIASYKISRLADGKNDGELTLGAMDPSKYRHSTLVVVDNVSKDGFWEIALDGVRVGRKDMKWSNRTAILDTGTTLLLAPKDDVAAIHAAIAGSKYNVLTHSWTIPCTGRTGMSFTIGGRSFPIDARDLLFLPVDTKDRTGDCISGITEGMIGGPDEWLVGDVLLKNVYFSTDAAKNEISVARLA